MIRRLIRRQVDRLLTRWWEHQLRRAGRRLAPLAERVRDRW